MEWVFVHAIHKIKDLIIHTTLDTRPSFYYIRSELTQYFLMEMEV